MPSLTLHNEKRLQKAAPKALSPVHFARPLGCLLLIPPRARRQAYSWKGWADNVRLVVRCRRRNEGDLARFLQTGEKRFFQCAVFAAFGWLQVA